jgi:hypothetical protein
MSLRERFTKLLAYERAVFILSFWAAVIFFVLALAVGRILYLVRDTEPVSFLDAGRMFLSGLILCVMLGTLLNVFGFLVCLIRDTFRRASS